MASLWVRLEMVKSPVKTQNIVNRNEHFFALCQNIISILPEVPLRVSLPLYSARRSVFILPLSKVAIQVLFVNIDQSTLDKTQDESAFDGNVTLSPMYPVIWISSTFTPGGIDKKLSVKKLHVLYVLLGKQ